MPCKGKCSRYRVSKLPRQSHYAGGRKRCQECEVFIKWEGLFCPCCGFKLRTKPRNNEYKNKLRESQGLHVYQAEPHNRKILLENGDTIPC